MTTIILNNSGGKHDATFEEFAAYLEYVQKNGANLDETELAQVSGGKGAGLSWLGCCGVGFGAGAGGGSNSGGACLLLGVGWGGSNCSGEGDSIPIDDSWR